MIKKIFSNYEKTKVAPNLNSIVAKDPYQILFKKFGPKYKIYRRKWEDTGKRLYVTGSPVHLDIDITGSCNLSCQYCPQNTHYGWTANLMSEAIFEKILEEAEKEGVYSINIGWNTEPLVNPKIFLKLLDVLDGHKIMDIFLHTNTVGLRKDIQERILKSKINTVCFSLGAFNDETRKKHLKDIKKNIISFKKLRDKARQELPLIRIGVIPMKENIKKISNYIDFWKKYADYIELQDVTLVSREIDKIYKKKKFNCNNPWRRLSINSKGDIYPCCGFTFFSKNVKLGNIKDISLKEAWNSKKIKELRKKLKSNDLKDYPGCNLCLNTLYSIKINKL